jgi:hypothetical protein
VIYNLAAILTIAILPTAGATPTKATIAMTTTSGTMAPTNPNSGFEQQQQCLPPPITAAIQTGARHPGYIRGNFEGHVLVLP